MALVYLWDSYPSDSVREIDVPLPQKPDEATTGVGYHPDLMILLIDDIVAYNEDPENVPERKDSGLDLTDDGCYVLQSSFGRLYYKLYWHPTDHTKAGALALKEYNAMLNLSQEENQEAT